MPIMGSWNRPIVLVSSPDPESAPVSAALRGHQLAAEQLGPQV
jgi:hypothetical protein